MSNLALSTILLPMCSGVLCLILGKIHGKLRDWFAVVASAVTFILALNLIPRVAQAPVYFEVWKIFNIGGMTASINVDSLSLFMLCLISFLGFLATLYSLSYMKEYKNLNLYYFLILVFIGSMNGTVISGDFVSFFLFWELMTVSSFLLVVFDGKEESRKAGIKYFIMTAVGSLLMFLGIAIVFRIAGTLSIPHLMASRIGVNTGLMRTALILFMIGLGVKAGVVPLHTWLPDAHPAAPSPISSLLSGVMIKVGIYMMVRIFWQVFRITVPWNIVICAFGAVTILVGVMFALVQHDAKRLLAFHSISQIGYMVLGIGIGTYLGTAGALFHLLNHACFKGLLFLCIGAIIYRTGERDLEKLGGLARSMPVTFFTCLVASLSISGIPPFNGFASKWMIYQALVEKGGTIYLVFLAAAMFGSALTLASFVKMLHSTFLGQRPSELKEVKEVDWKMQVPMIILACLCIIFGVFVKLPLQNFIGPVVGEKLVSGVAGTIVLKGIWSPTVATVLMILGAALGLIIYAAGKMQNARTDAAYIGGEVLNDKIMRVPGTRFYDTVISIEPLTTIYKKEEEGKMDLYPPGITGVEDSTNFIFKYIENSIDKFYRVMGKAGAIFADALRALHSGVLSSYVLWCLLGFVILLILIM